jgi:NADH dehydrogenase [ubiquinone] 1 alpha subcomplex assembly factor 7
VTRLAAKLVAQIRASGPITIADYMAACLGDPEHGYYMRREPFGRGGDFTTAPEISQIFGELLGLWAVAVWQAMGAPSPVALAELGPGRGTLMADAMRATCIRPAFGTAADIHLVETSPRLQAVQRQTLAGLDPAWCLRVEDLPAGPMILIANEFFDALPIRQFVRSNGGWAERMIGIGADGGLGFGLRPAMPVTPYLPSCSPHPSSYGEAKPRPEDPHPQGIRRVPESGPPLNPPIKSGEGDDNRGLGPTVCNEEVVREISPAALAIVETLSGRLMRDGGAALIIDYGHTEPGFGDTLQAVRHHHYDDVLAAPGESDLTAHVDFAALSAGAAKAGAFARPVLTQGEFLRRIGIAERAEALARGKDQATRSAIGSAVARLVEPRAMGELFKVLAISSPGLALPGFDDTSG